MTAHIWYIPELLGEHECCRVCGVLRAYNTSGHCPSGMMLSPLNEFECRTRQPRRGLRSPQSRPATVGDDGESMEVRSMKGIVTGDRASPITLPPLATAALVAPPLVIRIARALCNADGCPLDNSGCERCEDSRISWLIKTAERIAEAIA